MRTQIHSLFLCLYPSRTHTHTHTVDLRHCRSAYLSDSEMWRWVNPATHPPIKHEIRISNPQTRCSNTLALSLSFCMSSKPRGKISVLSLLLPKKSVHFSEITFQTDQSIPLKLVTPCHILSEYNSETVQHAATHILKYVGLIFQLKIIEYKIHKIPKKQHYIRY